MLKTTTVGVAPVINWQKGALADYNKAIAMNAKDAKFYNYRAVVRNDLGDPQGAIADYQEAIGIKLDYAEAYLGRGKVRSQMGDKQQAIDDFVRAASQFLQQ
jgi:tetratricopeptide (TPR) repeat protein